MATLDIPATVVGYGIYTTLVGGPTCISTDDGDTSYMEQDVVASSGSSAGYNDQINFPATPIPGDVTSVSLVTVSKGTDTRSSGRTPPGIGALFQLTSGDPDYLSWFWYPVLTQGGDWAELVTPLQFDNGSGLEEVITKERLEAGEVEYNPGYALLRDLVGATSGAAAWNSKWTYIALRVTYTLAVESVVRQYPRDDEKGWGSGTRLYPPTKADRVIGGIQ